MATLTNRISVRDHMVSIASNGRGFFDAVDELGVSCIELQLDPDLTAPHVRKSDGKAWSLAEDLHVRDLKDVLDGQNIRLSALLLATDFCSDQAEDHIAWTIRATEIARALGAPVIRVDPLTRNKEVAANIVGDNFVSCIKRVLSDSAGSGVDLGIENHGPLGNDPAFLDGIFSRVDNARLGMTLDTGNFYWWGVPLEELYQLLERYAPRAKHTHIKNIDYPPELAAVRRLVGLDYHKHCCALDEGNIDLRRVIGILVDAGYQRDFCIENESLKKSPVGEQLDVLQRDVEAMRRAMGGL